MSHTGRCHCGVVRYTLDAEPTPLVNCHCRDCRRAHGAAFVTTSPIPTRALTVTGGEERIRRHGQRYFCRECGTRLWNRLDDRPGLTVLVVATLDREPEAEPALHVNVGSAAPWHVIRDDAPRFEGLPPGVEATFERFEEE